jgi:predicted kinase
MRRPLWRLAIAVLDAVDLVVLDAVFDSRDLMARAFHAASAQTV